jgi:hypothetical protein
MEVPGAKRNSITEWTKGKEGELGKGMERGIGWLTNRRRMGGGGWFWIILIDCVGSSRVGHRQWPINLGGMNEWPQWSLPFNGTAGQRTSMKWPKKMICKNWGNWRMYFVLLPPRLTGWLLFLPNSLPLFVRRPNPSPLDPIFWPIPSSLFPLL